MPTAIITTPVTAHRRRPVMNEPPISPLSNLADLMEWRGPHPALSPFTFAYYFAQQQYSRMIVYVRSSKACRNHYHVLQQRI